MESNRVYIRFKNDTNLMMFSFLFALYINGANGGPCLCNVSSSH